MITISLIKILAIKKTQPAPGKCENGISLCNLFNVVHMEIWLEEITMTSGFHVSFPLFGFSFAISRSQTLMP